STTAVALAGLAAIVGHMFTIFLKGQGGKGVATSLGVALGLSPPLALLCFAVYALAYAATRLSSLGSLLGIWSFPVAALVQGRLAREYIWLSVATALLVTLRHRDNITRLLRGEEKRT
ncbi:MAG: glycerol-3-phosphate acyltransferase, partial [Polyangia bacterium]